MKTVNLSIFFLCLLSICLIAQQLHAQDEKPDVYYPSTSEEIDARGNQKNSLSDMPLPSTLTLMSQVFVFLIVLGGVALLLRNFARKGKLTLKPNMDGQGLVVAETKALGNKQFLVVVEYGSQKILLGVGPGMINHLCYLTTPFEDREPMKEEHDFSREKAGLPPLPPLPRD